MIRNANVVIVLLLALLSTTLADELKPRLVVLSDIAPNNVEPDDMESMIRLLAHADLFEIEALVATTGWSNTGHGGWGGYFEKETGPDKKTIAYTNYEGTPARAVSRKYEKRFYPAIFNSFAARVDWAANGKGNRNPVAVVNGDESLDVITVNPAVGTSVELDASATSDPDNDKVTYSWWMLPEAGTDAQDITITGRDSSRATVQVPADAAGQCFHVICEATDDGSPKLTAYR